MSTAVTFNGTSYSIPASGETSWSSLSNFLIDVANNAQTKGSQTGSVRIALTSPVAVASTDYAVFSKLTSPGAVAVTLPTGVDGKILIIGDATGDAGTNNITITGSIDGSASYVIGNNYAAVALQYSQTLLKWKVLWYYTGANIVYPVSGTLATLAGTEVLTNKTLTGNTIVTFVGGSSAVITAPSATGTLATLAGSETLTNKILTGNTLVTFVGGSSAVITAPSVTGTLATLANTETFTNKILTGNTIVTFIGGSSAVITAPSATGTLSTIAGAETLTNKILTGNTIISFIGGSSSTITAPSASGTLATLAGTENLSNKTFTDKPLMKLGIDLEDPGAGTNKTSLLSPTLAGNQTITLPVTPTNGYGVITDGSGNWSYAAVASVVNNLYVAKSANYTILDNDNYRVINVTAGGTDKTITLPAAANNTNRIITIKKADASVGNVIISGNIDGVAVTLYSKTDEVTIISDGTNWDGMGFSYLYKEYAVSTAYTNGTPAISAGTGISSVGTIYSGWLRPRQTALATWVLEFNIAFAFVHPGGSIQDVTFALSGITWYNDGSSIGQSFNGLMTSGAAETRNSNLVANTGNFRIITSAAVAQNTYYASGIGRLASKPTWAD